MISLNINGHTYSVQAPDDMPLLWILRDLLNLKGTKFGCGIAQCGACTVHLDGQAIRSCITPVSAAVGKKITTIEDAQNDKVGQAAFTFVVVIKESLGWIRCDGRYDMSPDWSA